MAAPYEDPRWIEFLAAQPGLTSDHPGGWWSEEPDDANHEPTPAEALELWEQIEGEMAQPPGPLLAAAAAGPVVTRGVWGARQPRSATALPNPIGVACHYEGPHLGTFEHARCFVLMRGIQAYHMDHNGWADIAYNFLTCPHGFVFIGRGSRVRSAANGTNTGNASYEAVCALIGDGDAFTDDNRRAFWTAAEFTDFERGPWRSHSFFVPTSCPGGPIREWLSLGHPRPGGVPDAPLWSGPAMMLAGDPE